MESRATTVIIAGGSIAGLSLANMLQRIDVDFLVLERGKEYAPQVGASIGIFPNGARLLDQLGCYQRLEDMMQGTSSFGTMSMKNQGGNVVHNLPGANQLFIKHFGYAPLFCDRQMLLQVLYDNLRDKDKVLLGEGVVEVVQAPTFVEVVTQQGHKYRGEVLVGADGIHSTVRREMWRLADAENSRYFLAKERIAIAFHYDCIFGISKPISDFPKSSTFNIFGQNYSYLVAAGPGERIYWFLFKKLIKKRKISVDDIPRYDKQDRDELAKEHANDRITGDIRFKDLYDNHISATLTALPEKVFSKWYYGRIITIGDAAHKFNPVGGQGGSSAMETAAALTNELARLYGTRPEAKKDGLSQAEITAIFKATQGKRRTRVQGIMQLSHWMSKIFALENFVIRQVVRLVLPLTQSDSMIHGIGSNVKAVTHLEMLDVPSRPHYNLYDDERPAKP